MIVQQRLFLTTSMAKMHVAGRLIRGLREYMPTALTPVSSFERRGGGGDSELEVHVGGPSGPGATCRGSCA